MCSERASPCRSSTAFLSALLAAWIATIVPMAAAGQAPERGETVRERPREAYDATGFRAGAFLLFPTIDLGVRHEDNVYRVEDGEVDDFVTFVHPRIRAVSSWANHEIALDAGVEADFFDSNGDEDSTDWFVTTAGRLDVLRHTNVSADLDLRRRHEDRGDPNATQVGEPVVYDSQGVGVGGFHRFNRLALRVEGRSTELSYDQASQGDRDRRRSELMLRAGYEIVPEYEAFVRVHWNRRDYERRQGRFDRDSRGWKLVVGTARDLGGLVFGEVSAGYRKQDYDDPRLPAVDGLAIDGSLTWNVTPLTTVNAFVERSVEESVLDASAFLATSSGVGVDHELLRNLILGADLGMIRNRYEPVAGAPRREDERIGVGIEGTWLVNRHLHAALGYRFEKRRSTAAGADYDNNVLTLGMRLQY